MNNFNKSQIALFAHLAPFLQLKPNLLLKRDFTLFTSLARYEFSCVA